MADTELQQLIIYVGTVNKIKQAMDAGTITENDLSIATDAENLYNIDGGNASAKYLISQRLDGGNAEGDM